MVLNLRHIYGEYIDENFNLIILNLLKKNMILIEIRLNTLY